MNLKAFFTFFLVLTFYCSAYADINEIYFIAPTGATGKFSRLFYEYVKEFNHKHMKNRIIFIPLQEWDIVISQAKEMAASGKKFIFISEVSQTYEIENLNIATNYDDFYGNKKNELKKINADIFIEYSKNSFGKDGKMYGLPIFRSMPVVFYNLDYLKKAGYNQKNLPKNWFEFKIMLEKMKQALNMTPFVLAGDWYDFLFEALVIQAGGRIIDSKNKKIKFYSPEAIVALTYWKELIDAKLMKRVENWKGAINGFIAGKFPVIFYSSGGMGSAQETEGLNWLADMLPKNKKYGCPYGGGNLYLGKTINMNDRDFVIEFIKTLYQPHIAAEISDLSGYLPVTKSSFKLQKIKDKYNKIQAYKNVFRQVPYAQLKMMGIQNLKIRESLKKAIDRTLDEGMQPEKSLKKAQQELDKFEY